MKTFLLEEGEEGALLLELLSVNRLSELDFEGVCSVILADSKSLPGIYKICFHDIRTTLLSHLTAQT